MPPSPVVRASLLVLSLLFSACASTGGAVRGAGACASPQQCEQRASARLEAVRRNPAALAELLARFPKGGDLHNHVAGAVYAESYLAWAREDGLRLDDKLVLVDPTKCGTGTCNELPASPQSPQFDAVVRAWSMKDFSPGAESGHDHFFAAFARFGVVSHEAKREGAMLAEAMRRAAAEGALYLELMDTVIHSQVVDLVTAAGPLDAHDLAGYERKLRADPRWAELVAASAGVVEENDQQARALLGCGTPKAEAACSLTVRYLSQVGRTAPAAQVFAELLGSFEVAAAEPRVAGVNLASPEDNATAQQDYDLQMAMLGFLEGEFQGRSPLRVTLHAGELIPSLVPAAHPEWLQSHIRDAVEIAHAERIGHGVDVLGERDAKGLLAELHDRGVTVEICLSSNAIILRVSGAAHPLGAYLAAGVPVVLATDDAGVSRSSLTGEYLRAVTVQGVTYPQLKAMARRSVTAAFVPGASLWEAGDAPRMVAACAGSVGAERPSEACAGFLRGSERAQLQWRLEQQLAAFERQLPASN